MNKRIIIVLIVFSVLFLSLIGYLTYYEIMLNDKIAANPYNQRQWAYEEDVVRGKILDSEGVVLADNKDNERFYPYSNMYSHIIGYNSKVYGKTGLEAKYNKFLIGKDNLSDVLNINTNKEGFNLNLTINHELQKLAYNRLGKRNGSVIAMNPKTGEILAMVSKPDFNPNIKELTDNWSNLTEDEDAPLLPRATNGLYAPGSIFKIITSVAAIENGLEDETFNDTGKITIDGKTFENQGKKSYGKVDLTGGFKYSSNVVFCSLSEKIGFDKLKETAERFGFNKPIDFDLAVSSSRFPTKSKDAPYLASLSIGQGDILATPLQMTNVACAIANGGSIMKPIIVKSVTNKNDVTILENKPVLSANVISSDVAEKVKDMMVQTVKSGTGTYAAIKGIEVAGKTGTAENEESIKGKSNNHTWFTCFAPADDPEIAVTVMMEYSGGSGGNNCAPIARDIISAYLK